MTLDGKKVVIIKVYTETKPRTMLYAFCSVDSFVSYVNSNNDSDWFADQIHINGIPMNNWEQIEHILNNYI